MMDDNKTQKLPCRYLFQLIAVGYGEDEDEAFCYILNKIAVGEENDVLDSEVVWEKDDSDAEEGPFDHVVWNKQVAES